MLSLEQQTWLNKLSDTKKVEILPYDQNSPEIFDRQKSILEKILGSHVDILHKGASSWQISGKGDIDIYIPVAENQFDDYFILMKAALGEPGSYYSNERVRWNKENDKVEIFLVNQDTRFWRESLLFWDYIETHPEVLGEYEKIKAEADGLSVRDYYTRKALFIQNILDGFTEQP